MQRYRDRLNDLAQEEAPEIDSIERPKAFDYDQELGAGSVLRHEKIERPDGSQRCGICGKPWPCSGGGAFAVKG